jgi:peptidoglycan-associated lipoprotein
MRPLMSLAALASSFVLLSACSSVKLDEKPPVEERATTKHTSTPVEEPRSIATVTTGSTDPLDDKNSVLAKRSVYFDFDSYIVKEEFKPVVSAHGQYISTQKNRKIIIQGNTDERGGREYNLALGQKRAEAVRKSLATLGVPETQMEAVSLGKEKPKATGNDEAAWAENRRADITYQ